MTEVVSRLKVEDVRDAAHLVRIKRMRCCIPGCRSIGIVDPHHPKHLRPGWGSVRGGDDTAVPLGRWCHHDAEATDGVHATGDEGAWWARHGVDPIALAARLWSETQALRRKK